MNVQTEAWKTSSHYINSHLPMEIEKLQMKKNVFWGDSGGLFAFLMIVVIRWNFSVTGFRKVDPHAMVCLCLSFRCISSFELYLFLLYSGCSSLSILISLFLCLPRFICNFYSLCHESGASTMAIIFLQWKQLSARVRKKIIFVVYMLFISLNHS